MLKPCGDMGAERQGPRRTGSLCLGVSALWAWPAGHALGRSGLVLTVLAIPLDGYATHH
jgi:hypothetical protein